MQKAANHQSNNAAQESGNADRSPKSTMPDRTELQESESRPAAARVPVVSKVAASGEDSQPSPETQAEAQLTNEQQRAELASVLATETFKRSPKLSRLLTYLCDKYFSGEGDGLKEYSIAVDVLGRDTEFDPQLDAVVRVDTHHLRKRLKQYYASEGSSHGVQIVIPTGQYAPRFILNLQPHPSQAAEPPEGEIGDEALTLAGENDVEKFAAGERAEEKPKPSAVVARWLVIALAVVVAIAAGLWMTNGRSHRADAANTAKDRAAGAAASPGGYAAQDKTVSAIVLAGDTEGIRILAGDHKGNYVDKAGHTWLSDRYFTGGETFRHSREIARTQDPEIFRSGRQGQFVYEIPLNPGTYELHLYFAETGVESEGLRSVSLAINGRPVSTTDVASDADGVNTATMKIYKNVSPAKDGILQLTFQGTGPSFVNALEVLPGTPGKMLPVRLAARDTVYRDHFGQIWMPDQYFQGGRRSARKTAIEGTADPELYIAQRFGHFSYAIPVVEGARYTVTLHFAETYFAPSESVGGIGSRVFDVYCNGTTLLKDFDILKETEGAGNRSVVKVFHDVPASPQGKINLTFVPITNYALVTAIEVTEE